MGANGLDLSQPRRTGQLLAATFQVLRTHGALLMSVTLLVAAPAVVLLEGEWAEGSAGGRAAAWVSAFLLPPAVTALHAVIVRDLGDGGRPGIGSLWRAAGPRLPAAVGAVTVYLIGVVLGACLIIPGIWLYVAGYFAAQAAVLEHEAPLGALERSLGLVRGRWKSTCGALLASLVLFELPSELARVAISPLDAGIVRVAGLIAVETITLSLTALFGTLLFFSLRADDRSMSRVPQQTSRA